jgi:methylenetetrahydrofolate dehydrogenase (NADP+)/methenyltetrahydrofolate cyclohydrolase
MKYLEYCDWDPAGKNVTIIGRSDIVGKPLAKLMTDADATVTLCHSKTNHLYQHIFHADLLVTAVGKPKFINCYPIHIPEIDVGINFDENGKICGDCINTENKDVTPVPGGVGLMTRCMLLENVCKAAEMRE